MTTFEQDIPARHRRIVEVFADCFGPLAHVSPDAFRIKFRKMAAGPFAFYRGSAPLFYADVAGLEDPFLDERTSRVWIHGDLHPENFGTYMNAEGAIVFDVNDFDEAYVGPFTWDLQRLAAGLALVGWAKALSDAEIAQLVAASARAYADQVAAFERAAHGGDFALTRENTSGTVQRLLLAAASRTRAGVLDEVTAVERWERRFVQGDNVFAVDAEERACVLDGFERYLETLPNAPRGGARPLVKDVVARRGVGIGSAGLRSYNLLVEGATQALETDVLLYMKLAQPAAPARAVEDADVRAYFLHEGHRTVVSQRALQAYADPWLGHTTLGDAGQLVAEVSPYALDLDWGDVNTPEEMLELVGYLGRATAKIHCVSDVHSDHTLVPFHTEEAIGGALAGREDELVRELVQFAHEYAARVRDDHRLFVDAFRNGELALV